MKYYVYVIELDTEVSRIKNFMKANLNYVSNYKCYYVGQTTRNPLLRFEQHKEGYKSNKYAKKYGLRLQPILYKKYNPIPSRSEAEKIEKYLGELLRSKGYGVWYN